MRAVHDAVRRVFRIHRTAECTECTEPDFSTRVRRAKTLEVRCWTFTAGWVSPCAWRQHSRELRPPAHASTRSVRIPPAPPAGRTARIPPPGSWHPSLHAPPFALRARRCRWPSRPSGHRRALVRFVPGSRALVRFVPKQYSAVPRYLFAACIALPRSTASPIPFPLPPSPSPGLRQPIWSILRPDVRRVDEVSGAALHPRHRLLL